MPLEGGSVGTRLTAHMTLHPKTLVPVLDESLDDDAIRTAAGLAEAVGPGFPDPTVVVFSITPDPTRETDERRHAAAKALHVRNVLDAVDVEWSHRATEDVADAIVAAVAQRDASVVLFDEPVDWEVVDAVGRETDAVVLYAPTLHDGVTDRVVVAVAGGPNMDRSLDVAGVFAARFDRPVRLVHVVDPDADEETVAAGRSLLRRAADRFDDDAATTSLVRDDDVPAVLAGEDGLLVLGAPTTSGLRRLAFGSTTTDVLSIADDPLIVWGEGGDP
ncbi:universal stress protein [Haloarchaeobius baliensis]|uniref:universal stress protein n=1 Tax=Haloarchaeobius baliensis TaxID=1670458 RepID=UPI003F882975